MRIVVALGGNALLRRGQALTAENQRENIRGAAATLAPLAREHQLVITHGNGPQVGLLALQSAAYAGASGGATYPFDVLGAESQGMIGYMIEQEFDTILAGKPLTVTLLTQVEVDPHDPAFADPTKFVGPVYEHEEAERFARERGWVVKQDGAKWRRVVGASTPMLVAAIGAAGIVLVTFVFTTLIHEPASIVTLVAILGLSVALDFGWKRVRANRVKAEELKSDE